MSKPGVSVVICTHNGASKLPETIKHIAFQHVPSHVPWELVIIENACNDNTIDLVQSEWQKNGSPTTLRIVNEDRLGLSYARSKGFATATYDYVLLCDDDNWLCSDYVDLVYQIMSTHQNIGALGGNGELIFEVEPPDWIQAFSVYAGGEQGKKSGKVERSTLYGAGCVIRNSAYKLLQQAGFRSLLTDRLGKELSSGGDYELCYALIIAGFDIWYDDRLTFKHFITKDRMTREYYLKYLHESSTCFEVLEPYKIISQKKSLGYTAFRILMVKILAYFVRKYLWVNTKRMFFKKGSVQNTILTLRSYSVRSKISIFLRNGKMIRESYRHGKALQQKFSKSSAHERVDSSEETRGVFS